MRTIFNNLFRHGIPDTMPLMEKYELHKRGVCPPACGFCKDERDEIVRHAHLEHAGKKVNINK